MVDARVIEDFLRHELALEQPLHAVEVQLRLLKLELLSFDGQPGAGDLSLARGFLGLQILVIQLEQNVALLDLVADVQRELGDQPADFRSHGNGVERPDVTRRGHRKVDVPRRHDGRGERTGFPGDHLRPGFPERNLVRVFLPAPVCDASDDRQGQQPCNQFFHS